MRQHIAAILLFGFLPGISGMRAVAAQAEFEVASIKPAAPGVRASFTQIEPGGERFTATHATLKLLVMAAYGVTDRQVSGGPNWVNSEYYDIEAKAADPERREQILEMVQALLADRFRLKLHKETRDVPIYVLAGGGGYGLRESKTANRPQVKVCDNGQYVFRDFPIAQLAWYLSLRLHRDVVDKTGLAAAYDFELAYRPDTPSLESAAGARPPDDSQQLSLEDAVRDQLGLRLQSQQGPSEILVIDAAEKPPGN